MWMQVQTTSLYLCHMIITMLNHWHSNLQPSCYQSQDPHINKIAADLSSIGWSAFLKGFIASLMVRSQHKNFLYIGSLRSGPGQLPFVIRYGHSLNQYGVQETPSIMNSKIQVKRNCILPSLKVSQNFTICLQHPFHHNMPLFLSPII